MTASACAERLFRAHAAALPCDGLGDLQPPGDVAGGYAVQTLLDDLGVAAGRRPIGWKVGVTSPGAMALFKASEPMAGVIYEDSVIADGGILDLSRCCQPKIEGELLIRVGHVPHADADDAELVASIAAIHPAIEVAESRIAGWPADLGQAIADNACCGHLVLGPAAAPGLDMAAIAMTMRRDGEIVAQGRGSDCLGSPLAVYRWLLRFADARGWRIRAGDVILTGAMGLPVAGAAPATYEAHLSGVGTVGVHIAVA